MAHSQITLNNVVYHLRDIVWPDLDEINLYPFIEMMTRQAIIIEPYKIAIMKDMNLKQPLSDEDALLVVEALKFTNEDLIKLKKLEYEYTGLYNTLVRIIVVKPSLKNIKPSVGINLLHHPEIKAKIAETIKDISSTMQSQDYGTTPAKK